MSRGKEQAGNAICYLPKSYLPKVLLANAKASCAALRTPLIAGDYRLDDILCHLPRGQQS
jgi:hypothetical protein